MNGEKLKTLSVGRAGSVVDHNSGVREVLVAPDLRSIFVRGQRISIVI